MGLQKVFLRVIYNNKNLQTNKVHRMKKRVKKQISKIPSLNNVSNNKRLKMKTVYWLVSCLLALLKASASKAEDSGFESCLRRDFSSG